MGWKQSVVISMIIISLSPAHADDMTADDFYDFLGETEFIHNVSEIEYIENEWTPNQTLESFNNTNAWIDIVGYNYSVRKDDVFYINQSHEDAARVLYGISNNIQGETWWNWGVETHTGDIIDRSYDGSCVTVTLESTLVYYEAKIVCTTTWLGHFCHVAKTYYTDVEYFTETDCNPPLVYPALNISHNSTVNVYNNSYAPKIIINIPYAEYMLGYRVEYQNEAADYYYNIMRIDHLENGFPYGNFTPSVTQGISSESNVFFRMGDNIIINNGSMNGDLNISVLTPFTNQEINYTVVNCSSEFEIDKENICSAFNVILLCFMGIFLVNYYKGKL